jgi:ABC-type xylose transport system permease subunit
LAGGAGLRVQRLALWVAMIAVVLAAAALLQTARDTSNTSTSTQGQPTAVPSWPGP